MVKLSLNKLLLILSLIFGLASCGSNTSTATYEPPSNIKDNDDSNELIPSRGTIFQIDEETLYELVYSAYQEVLPEAKVSVLTFPARGYTTKWLAPPYYLDWYYITVKILRVEGLDGAKNSQQGYLVDVSGKGSSFLQGKKKQKELFQSIYNRLNEYGSAVKLTAIKRADFLLDRKRMYVKSADTLG